MRLWGSEMTSMHLSAGFCLPGPYRRAWGPSRVCGASSAERIAHEGGLVDAVRGACSSFSSGCSRCRKISATGFFGGISIESAY